MTDTIDIDHLCRLARLTLDDTTRDRVRTDLINIIGMIDHMQAIDTSHVEPMANPLDAHQRLRSDEVTEEVEAAQFQYNAPETEADYYLVPRVVE